MNRNSHARRALGMRAGWVIAAVGAALVACALGAALVAHAVAPVSPVAGYDADRVSALPTLGPVSMPEFAGYASASPTPCANLLCTDRAGLFYWMFGRSANYASQPTIVWSNGGPGSSSFYGPLTENGPYDIDSSGRLVPNPNSWTKAANYLFFDHPLGVGLSFPFHGQIARNMSQGIDELYNALVHVVARRGLQRSPLFLTGESLGGTYMPLLAQRILDGQRRRATHITLGGVIITAGFVDPLVQVSTTAEYALDHGLIDARQKARLDEVLAECRRLMRGPPPSSPAATKTCFSIQDKVREWSGRFLDNIGLTGDIDYTPLLDYVNRPDVRRALHAKPGGEFSLYSPAVGEAYERGGMDSYLNVVAQLLGRGVPVMVITGLNDAKDTNLIGTRAWISRLRWRGAARFRAAPRQQWRDGKGGVVLGYVQRGGGLTTLDVIGAGHLAVRDQPKILDQVRTFIARSGS
jgi:vitellogenic carboxypeptidase-like protein